MYTERSTYYLIITCELLHLISKVLTIPEVEGTHLTPTSLEWLMQLWVSSKVQFVSWGSVPLQTTSPTAMGPSPCPKAAERNGVAAAEQ